MDDHSSKKIRSNIEYLKKLFIMPDSPDKFVEFGHELLELIHVFFQDKGGIHSSITLPELGAIFNRTAIPGEPSLIKDVLGEIKSKIIAHSVKVGNPYYIGHMTSAIPYFMILLEMIIAALNQNQVKIETAKASSFVEREFTAWIHRLVYEKPNEYYKEHIQNHHVALGNITTDGTFANLTALLVAREKAFPSDGKFKGIRKEGFSNALSYYGYKRGVIIVSSRGHYSIRKAANTLGVGEDNVWVIPVDDNNRVDIGNLKKRISDDAKNSNDKGKTKIIAIVGIAGTTETGSVDNLEELGEIAKLAGVHFHVDACWGGSALLVDEYRHLFKGIEKADSVSIDTHKLLYCPMSMGIILFRNENDLGYIKHSSQYIIRKNSVDQGRFTIQGSRPFSCLKPWAALKIIGKEGYGLLFKQATENTKTLKWILDNYDNFETLNDPELFILNYRFCTDAALKKFGEWKKISESSRDQNEINTAVFRIKKLNHLINGLTIKLHKALRRDDTTFVSRTTLESTRYRPQKIVVLRAVLINPLTSQQILNEIVQTQNRIGIEMWKNFEPAFKRIQQMTP